MYVCLMIVLLKLCTLCGKYTSTSTKLLVTKSNYAPFRLSKV